MIATTFPRVQTKATAQRPRPKILSIRLILSIQVKTLPSPVHPELVEGYPLSSRAQRGNLVAVATVVLGTCEGIQTPLIRRIPSILFIPVNNAPNANDFGKQLEAETRH